MGIAAALKEKGALDGLSGRIRLCAVPAEELLEIEYRAQLKKEGKIKYFGGKSEFLSRGYFDGVDLAFMVHTARAFTVNEGSVGCITKNIVFKGKAAHAGGAPQNGHNALYAASCGLNAINALRETFTESDMIRVHPIITQGGYMVNAIPDTVRLESYVRGRTFDAIINANAKVNRALSGAALSLGTNVETIDVPGYAPLENDRELIEVARQAAALALPNVEFKINAHYSSGSTDMGDLSRIMPVVHPYAGGARGGAHGSDYEIYDPVAACIDSAKWQLAMISLLLGDGACRARRIVQAYTPEFASKQEFLAYMDSLCSSGDRITYRDDGVAEVRL